MPVSWEEASREFFSKPLHPYARNLLKALPEGKQKSQMLEAIPGMVPRLNREFHGCRFAERCKKARPECSQHKVVLQEIGDRKVRCLFPKNDPVELPRSDVVVEQEQKDVPAFLKSRITAFGFRFAAVFCVRRNTPKPSTMSHSMCAEG
ncbi:MAG: oligopeptide/dipeptide ABC transporter ATP-binding protein [Parasutterella excrementihominis]